MPTYMYVSLQDDDKILMLAMDAATGHLTPQGEVSVGDVLRRPELTASHAEPGSMIEAAMIAARLGLMEEDDASAAN